MWSLTTHSTNLYGPLPTGVRLNCSGPISSAVSMGTIAADSLTMPGQYGVQSGLLMILTVYSSITTASCIHSYSDAFGEPFAGLTIQLNVYATSWASITSPLCAVIPSFR